MSEENDNYDLDVGLFTSPKWICEIPWHHINPELKADNMFFNLTSYNLPELTMGSTEIGHMGYNIEIPTAVRDADKTLTFEYLIGADLKQYLFLYDWFSLIADESGAGSNVGGLLSKITVPITVTLLSEFKKPLMAIKYHDCWLHTLGSFQLDYQDDAEVVKHDFSIKYSKYEFLTKSNGKLEL